MPNDIDIPAHENWVCFVGSGECTRPAVIETDNGEGGRVTICAEHWKEFQKMEKLLSSRPDLWGPLEEAINQAE